MKRALTSLKLGAAVLSAALIASPSRVFAQDARSLTRIAEIEIDAQQVEQYKTALREGIEAAIRLEPGVLSLYAVSVEGHPEQVRIFEVYASREAYEAHLQTPHFKKYKTATQSMVKSLTLIDTEPILLRAKR